MLSLDFTFSWYMPAALAAGAYLLWKQYRSTTVRQNQPGTRLLLLLQAAALVLLIFQLAKPRIMVGRDEFHDPVILIGNDQSGSFREGAFLNLERSFTDLKQALRDRYAPQGFAVHELAFARTANLRHQGPAGGRGTGSGL